MCRFYIKNNIRNTNDISYAALISRREATILDDSGSGIPAAEFLRYVTDLERFPGLLRNKVGGGSRRGREDEASASQPARERRLRLRQASPERVTYSY